MRCGWQREGFVSRNVGVKVENVHPADLLLPSAPAPTCGSGADLFISASSWCCSRISISAAHRTLSVGGFNRSQLYSPLPTVKTEPCAYHTICSSCYVSPSAPWPQCVTRPHCYHALICNLNPECCIFSFPNSTVSTQDSAVISCSPVHFLARAILARISACLSSNLCRCVN